WFYYRRVVRAARHGGWPNLRFVRYEDVVADPEREFGGILEFLGMPYEPQVAQGWGNKEGIPEREYAWKRRALEKITRDRVGAFRHELGPDQVEILERLGGPALRSLGYDLLTDGKRPLPRGFLLSLSLKMSQFVYRLPWRAVVRDLLSRSLPCASEELPAPAVPALA